MFLVSSEMLVLCVCYRCRHLWGWRSITFGAVWRLLTWTLCRCWEMCYELMQIWPHASGVSSGLVLLSSGVCVLVIVRRWASLVFYALCLVRFVWIVWATCWCCSAVRTGWAFILCFAMVKFFVVHKAQMSYAGSTLVSFEFSASISSSDWTFSLVPARRHNGKVCSN